MIDYTLVPVTPFQQNCSLVRCTRTQKCAVIDPGGEVERLLALIEERGLDVEKILLTHGHCDHAGGARKLADQLSVPIEGPQVEERFWLEMLARQASMFGLEPTESFEPDRWLEDGQRVQLGALELEVRHCPGHTPGHVIFVAHAARLAFVGDVLFKGSIGRSDFPRGDHATLLRSIREKIFTLGDDLRFVPGHGPTSTVGEERRTNPFLQPVTRSGSPA